MLKLSCEARYHSINFHVGKGEGASLQHTPSLAIEGYRLDMEPPIGSNDVLFDRSQPGGHFEIYR